MNHSSRRIAGCGPAAMAVWEGRDENPPRVFSLFTVPFSAGVIRTAAGTTQNINLSSPNPAAGATNVASSRSESWYNAMFLELRRRYSRGVQFSVGYTLAKAENLSGSGGGDGSSAEGAFGRGTPADQFNLASNRGLSPSDQRQRRM